MGDVGKTVGRAVAGVATLGLSELAVGMMQKPTRPSEEMSKPAEAMKVDEGAVEEREKAEERRKRQVIAQQNRNIRTSALGAAITAPFLGGTGLTGR